MPLLKIFIHFVHFSKKRQFNQIVKYNIKKKITNISTISKESSKKMHEKLEYFSLTVGTVLRILKRKIWAFLLNIHELANSFLASVLQKRDEKHSPATLSLLNNNIAFIQIGSLMLE